MHEIQRPLLVGRRVYAEWRAHAHAVLPLLPAQSQSGLAINPMHPFMVYHFALTLQQHMQASITKARLLTCQRKQTLAQTVVPLARRVAITRNRNQQQAASPALGEGELLTDVLHRCLHRCELHPFFSITDCRASLSRLRSATSLRSRPFSSRSRLAS